MPLPATCFVMVSCFAYAWSLKKETIYSPETSFEFHRNSWRYDPQDGTLHNHSCDNLKCMLICSFNNRIISGPIFEVLQEKYAINMLVSITMTDQQINRLSSSGRIYTLDSGQYPILENNESAIATCLYST
jgi:hypothetical protein